MYATVLFCMQTFTCMRMTAFGPIACMLNIQVTCKHLHASVYLQFTCMLHAICIHAASMHMHTFCKHAQHPYCMHFACFFHLEYFHKYMCIYMQFSMSINTMILLQGLFQCSSCTGAGTIDHTIHLFLPQILGGTVGIIQQLFSK